MTDINETVNMSEALARSIRDELRQHNDDNEPVLLLVRKVVSDLAAKASETCEWRENESDECWDTACGEKYVLTTGDGPLKHGFNFCHHCGKRLTETKHKEEGK